MVDQSTRYPRLPGRQWWALRDRFKQSIPTRVTPGYLAAALDMQEKSAAANVLPALRAVGLIDDDGKPTQRAVRWRDDELYREVVEEIRSVVYPPELLEAAPDPRKNRSTVERWFANRTGHGVNAARKMAAFYELLSSPLPSPDAPAKLLPSEAGRLPQGPSPRAIARTGGDPTFKLPGSSYSEIAKIIRGYLPFNSPISLEEVARTTGGMHPTNISRNTGFLVGLGVLEGGSKKMLTERGRSLARALDFDMPDEIRGAWREIVSGHEFVQQLISAVRIRGGMDTLTLQAHIAYSAGLPRSQSTATAAGAVIDVLRAADILRESDGKLVATFQRSAATPTLVETPTAPESDGIRQSSVLMDTSSDGIHISIQVQIQCSPADLEGLGSKLRSLLHELRHDRPSTNDVEE